MRIAFFTEGYDPFTNGVVVLLKAYREALERAGHEVVVFAPEHHGRPAFEDRVVRMPSFYWNKKTYPCLKPFVKNDRLFSGGHFDIVHSHHPFSCGLLAERLSKKHGIPLVYTFHTLLTNYSGYFPGARKVAEQGLLNILRRHCERADAVTVSTNIMERWLRDKGISSPIHVVRPPITLQSAQPGSRERIRRNLRIPENTVVALCASRLSLEKGVDFLLKSVRHLSAAHQDFRILLVGSGPQEAQLKADAVELGIRDKIIFAGEVPHSDMPSWYAAADLFAFPSKNDTLGLVLIEAMYSGLPCVAIDMNGPTEVVRHGETGYLVPFRDKVFASALQELIDTPQLREKLGRQARKWSIAQFGNDSALSLERAYEIAKERMFDRHEDHLKVFRGRKISKPKPKGSW